jgi:hypothetical protein
MDLFPGVNALANGPLNWRPEEIFADSRTFEDANRSRFVNLEKATPDGGALSFSKEHGKTAIVGRESMYINDEIPPRYYEY